MLLIRKSSHSASTVTDNAGVVYDERKAPKLSILGLFKRKGKELLTPQTPDHSQTGSRVNVIPPQTVPSHSDPQSTLMLPTTRTPNSIMDDAYITIVSSNEDMNYTHQERYESFTSECISLQNSEMTFELQKPRVYVPGGALLSIPATSLNAMIETTPNQHSTLMSNLSSNLSNNLTNDLTNDLTNSHIDLDISDTESDLNFDPKNEENEREYKHGGYHPVSKGEVYSSTKLDREYTILRKLGWGHFSTVWLAKSRSTSDDSNETESYVAIKFVKSNKNYLEAAEDEIRILQTLQNPLTSTHLSSSQLGYFAGNASQHPGHNQVMKLLDDFEVVGPHGNHICMVFEVLGENVLSLIYKYKQTTTEASSLASNPSVSPVMKFYKWDSKSFRKSTKSMLSLGLIKQPEERPTTVVNPINTRAGIPLNMVRQIIRQMLTAMDYVHHCGVIHTDLKPENILVEIDNVHHVIQGIERESKARRDTRRSTVKLNEMKGSKSTGSETSNSPANLAFSSKNSKLSLTLKSFDCPIRCSRPLPSSPEVNFRDFGWDTTKKHFESEKGSPVSPTSVGPQASRFSVKIADLGNATYSHSHFTNQIQTRQYRSPEIILKYKAWGALTDIWSLGCIIFELITGDFLFDPYDGKLFDKDEDHLAQIIELLGAYPSDEYLIDCKLTSKHFKLEAVTNKVVLKNIDGLKFWGLEEVFVEKYKFLRGDPQVRMMSDLILKCLKFNPGERFDCRSLLAHPWLRDGIEDELASVGGIEAIYQEMAAMQNCCEKIPGYTEENEDDCL